jgi:hypothetical protein
VFGTGVSRDLASSLLDLLAACKYHVTINFNNECPILCSVLRGKGNRFEIGIKNFLKRSEKNIVKNGKFYICMVEF